MRVLLRRCCYWLVWPDRVHATGNDCDCSLSGSTACICVARGNVLCFGNVGDSRAQLISTAPRRADAVPDEGSGLTCVALTRDHKPQLPSETKRILLAGEFRLATAVHRPTSTTRASSSTSASADCVALPGGRIASIRYEDGEEGPIRVWMRDDDVPGLAMSRAVCDLIGKRCGVSSEVEVSYHTLTTNDAFIVIASDGLWEFSSDRDIMDIIEGTYLEAVVSDCARIVPLTHHPPPNALTRLLRHSVRTN